MRTLGVRCKFGLIIFVLFSILSFLLYLSLEEFETREDLFTSYDLKVLEGFENQTLTLGYSRGQELSWGVSFQEVIQNELSINIDLIQYEDAMDLGELDFVMTDDSVKEGLHSITFPLLKQTFVITNRDAPLKSAVNLSYHKIGFLTDSLLYDEFRDSIGATYFFDSLDEGFGALENQEIDAFITRTSLAIDELIPRKNLQLEFTLQDNIKTYKVLTAKKELYPVLDIFDDILNSRRLNKLQEKLEESSLQNRRARIRDYIQSTYATVIEEHDSISIGHHGFSFPYSYFDKEGNSSGFYIELLDLFQMATDIPYDVQNSSKATNYEHLFNELTLNHIQFLFGMGAIQGSEKIVNLGSSVQDHLISIAKYQNKEVETKPLSEIRFGIVDTQEVSKHFFSDTNFELFEDYPSAFKAVLAGDLDVLIGRKSRLSYYQNVLGYTTLTQVNLITEKNEHRILGNVDNSDLNLLMEDLERLHQLISTEDQSMLGTRQTVNYQGRYLTLRSRHKFMMISILLLAGAVAGFVTFRMKKENKSLRSENERDKLTGLYNRSTSQRKCQELIEKNPTLLGAFFFFDLDDLKFCNDTYGHSVGDQLIIEFARHLEKFEDENTICSRIAGDEFGIFRMGFRSKEEIYQMISQMKQELNCNLRINNKLTLQIRFSAGGSIYNSDTTNFSNLKKYADLAMYQAKHEKKKMSRDDREAVTIKLFDIESFRSQSTHVIDTILKGKEIYAVFQSINSVESGEVFGYEGLTRTSNLNISNVVELIELAEARGKLRELDLLMMETSLRSFSGTGFLFVNMEYKAPELIEEYIEKMVEIAKEIGMSTDKIGIEVSERKQWSQKSLDTLNKLKIKYNFIIAIDDFGVGFANNYLLLNLKPDIVKIDRSLVSHIDEDKEKYLYLKALVEFIKKQNMAIIYEGIEIFEELNALQAIGKDYGQGWYFEKPKRHK